MALCVLCAHASNALAAEFEPLDTAVENLGTSVGGLINKYTQVQAQVATAQQQVESAKVEAQQKVATAQQQVESAKVEAQQKVATAQQQAEQAERDKAQAETEKQAALQQVATAQQQAEEADRDTTQQIKQFAVKIEGIVEDVDQAIQKSDGFI